MKKLLKKCFVFASALAIFFTTTFTTISCTSSKVKDKKSVSLTIDPAITKGTLENGMSYLIQKNSNPSNRISFRLVIKAGSLMETDRQKGVAHFIEHLAFNGTKNFEKNEIVNYFEKIGMQFGAGLNAYTSFEETVYNLDIPADDPAILKTAIAILHDWACAISFEQEEIDKERGVITEEWRSRSLGLQGRTSDKIIPFILKDSLFKDRLPIGDMNIIKSVTREEILDFYNTWYRPDLMTVIAVGDIEPKTLENAIKETMGKIPAKKGKVKLPNNKLPLQTEKSFCIFEDPEQPYPLINIFARNLSTQPKTTEDDIRQILVSSIASSCLNQRFSAITNQPESNWLTAAIGETRYNNNDSFYYIGFVPKEGKFLDCFKSILDELDKAMSFGITENELLRLKEYFLSFADQQLANKEKTLTQSFISDLLSYVLLDNIPLSIDENVRIIKEIIPTITIDEVNLFFSNSIIDYGTQFFGAIPKGYQDLPSEEDLFKIWTEHKNNQLSEYVEESEITSIMEKPTNKAKKSSSKAIKELGVTETILENGIKIITKKTDFEKNVVYMNASSKGGSFYIEDKDFPSYFYSVDYMLYSGLNGHSYNQLVKYLSNKTNFDFYLSIYDTSEVISGHAQNEDLEVLLQFVNSSFTTPQFDQNMWDFVMENAKVFAQSHDKQPHNVFYDKIDEILYGNDIRHSPFNMDFVSKMDSKAAENIYKERFANPADFTFVFVGDFDEQNLIELCQYYLGNLKTTPDKEETVYKYWDFPKGITSEIVKKGQDEQGAVEIIFGGELTPENDLEKLYKQSQEVTQLANFLDIKLREIIREDKSGTYGISVKGFIDGYPERYYKIYISFQCEPTRTQELTDAIISSIKDIQKNGIDDSYAKKLQETYRRNREVNLFENEWWLSRINAGLVFTYEPLWLTSDVEKVASWITRESLQSAAKKYLDTSNYVSVFLVPEK